MKHVEESYSFGEESSQQGPAGTGHAALSSGLSHSPHTTRRVHRDAREVRAHSHTLADPQAPSPQLRGWCICDTQITMQKTPVSLTRGLIPLNDYAGANVTGAPTVPLLCGCLSMYVDPPYAPQQGTRHKLCFTELDAEHPVLPQQQSMKPGGGRRVLCLRHVVEIYDVKRSSWSMEASMHGPLERTRVKPSPGRGRGRSAKGY